MARGLLGWRVGYSDGGGSITTAGSGQQFITMGGGPTSGTGGWTTNITSLLAGQTYRVDFQMASETSSFAQALTVDFTGGSATAPQNFTANPSNANYWRVWEAKSLNFIASASTATIRFQATTQQDVGLDNVRVSLVTTSAPEASTLTFIVLGGLMSGIALGRRR